MHTTRLSLFAAAALLAACSDATSPDTSPLPRHRPTPRARAATREREYGNGKNQPHWNRYHCRCLR